MGKFKRAPLFLRKAGFEWLWRVKEEPIFGGVTGTMGADFSSWFSPALCRWPSVRGGVG